MTIGTSTDMSVAERSPWNPSEPQPLTIAEPDWNLWPAMGRLTADTCLFRSNGSEEEYYV